MTEASQFSSILTPFLAADGKLKQVLPSHLQDQTLIQLLYRMMTLTRLFDGKAINLQRTGKLGTYPSSLGQEAVSVGYGCAMQRDDVLIPYYRDCGAQLQHGTSMADVLRYWGGDERGSNFLTAKEDFPISVPIATQLLHATGVAKAIQYRKEKRAVITTCGDGATSEGDFYEAINLAGCWKLPLVFIINNNQWAISVSRDKQTACPVIANKAFAGGFDGIQIDGNDIFSVYHTTQQALQKAREGGGPTLIEAVTYRLGDHTTADDASRYRHEKELQQAWQAEPIKRLRYYMENENLWSETQEQALHDECKQLVDDAVKDYLATPRQAVTDMFDYLYEQLPTCLEEQRETALYYGEQHD